MTRDEVLHLLQQNKQELTGKGVTHLRVFGSVARNEATDASDLDLLADFDPSMNISLLDIVHIESHLGTLVGKKVDLMEERSLKERIRVRAVREAVVAF